MMDNKKKPVNTKYIHVNLITMCSVISGASAAALVNQVYFSLEEKKP